MKKLTNILMNAVKRYTPVDFAIFKIYMVSVGMLIGVYCAPLFGEYLFLLWGVAILTATIVITQLIRYINKNRE